MEEHEILVERLQHTVVVYGDGFAQFDQYSQQLRLGNQKLQRENDQMFQAKCVDDAVFSVDVLQLVDENCGLTQQSEDHTKQIEALLEIVERLKRQLSLRDAGVYGDDSGDPDDSSNSNAAEIASLSSQLVRANEDLDRYWDIIAQQDKEEILEKGGSIFRRRLEVMVREQLRRFWVWDSRKNKGMDGRGRDTDMGWAEGWKWKWGL